MATDTGAAVVDPDEILFTEADIVAPCALGDVLNPDTIPRLRCKVVAGAANNQLPTEDQADALHARGIVYVPSVVANAGAVIKGASDALGESDRIEERMQGIAERTKDVLEIAQREGRTPQLVSHELAERLLVLAFER